MRRVPILLIRAYQMTIGQMVGGRCKYYPSCSQYALDAYEEFGLIRGTLLTGWRLLRCNPFSQGGVDHVCDKAAVSSQ